MTTADAGSAALQLVALVVVLTTLNFAPIVNNDVPNSTVHFSQLGAMIGMMVFYAAMTGKLEKPSAAATNQRVKRLHTALQKPGDTGLTKNWYDSAQSVLQLVTAATSVTVVAAVAGALAWCFPDSAATTIGAQLQAGWSYVLQTYSHQDIFCYGLYGCFFITFWTVSLLYAAIDFIRPSIFVPFKIQEDVRVTPAQFGKACALALLNQVILIPVIYGIWLIYPTMAPSAFSEELPSPLVLVLQLLACEPFAEFIFYVAHRILHIEWMFKHVHYVHHEWPTPVAVTAIFAHPVEFLMGNVPILALGPLVLGIHVVSWCLFVVIATFKTCHGHSGWHLPFGASMEAHDFHHSSGPGNYGNSHLLDEFFGTDVAYNKTWYPTVDKTYTTPDYPVDKVLNRPAGPKPECVYRPNSKASTEKQLRV